MMCANPVHSPCKPQNEAHKPRANPRTIPVQTPFIPRAQTPSLPKGREYSVPPSGERHTPMPVSAQIEALAFRVLRLTVSRRDPEQFFVERSDIAGEMRRLARAVR